MSDHVLAVWGATTGTIGSVVAITTAVFTLLIRRDAIWSRRARAQDARPAVEDLRERLVEVKHDPTRVKALPNSTRFAARLSELEETRGRCPDRRTRANLKRLATHGHTLMTVAVATDDPSSSYELTATVEAALGTATAILERLTKLDRKRPGA